MNQVEFILPEIVESSLLRPLPPFTPPSLTPLILQCWEQQQQLEFLRDANFQAALQTY